MAPYQRTTRDVWDVEGWYSRECAWEVVTSETTWKGAVARRREYVANEPGIEFRIVKHRERIAEGASRV